MSPEQAKQVRREVDEALTAALAAEGLPAVTTTLTAMHGTDAILSLSLYPYGFLLLQEGVVPFREVYWPGTRWDPPESDTVDMLPPSSPGEAARVIVQALLQDRAQEVEWENFAKSHEGA